MFLGQHCVRQIGDCGLHRVPSCGIFQVRTKQFMGICSHPVKSIQFCLHLDIVLLPDFANNLHQP
jgi:hypothetical protein